VAVIRCRVSSVANIWPEDEEFAAYSL